MDTVASRIGAGRDPEHPTNPEARKPTNLHPATHTPKPTLRSSLLLDPGERAQMKRD